MRQDEVTALRSTSFGAIANDYDRFRPGPPEAAVDWLVPAGATDVLELGAGTGALTRRLIARVDHVRAVEPDERMRRVLAERVSGAEIEAGTAEAIPAENASFDAVMMASAWHWVDEDKALPEVDRVLRPGGRLALIWSGPDRNVDWVKSVFVGGRKLTKEQSEVLDAHRHDRHSVHLGDHSPFSEPEREYLRWTLEMSKDEIVGLVGTFSVAITMDEHKRAAHLDAVGRHLDTLAHQANGGRFSVPMRCLCWRATLR